MLQCQFFSNKIWPNSLACKLQCLAENTRNVNSKGKNYWAVKRSEITLRRTVGINVFHQIICGCNRLIWPAFPNTMSSEGKISFTVEKERLLIRKWVPLSSVNNCDNKLILLYIGGERIHLHMMHNLLFKELLASKYDVGQKTSEKSDKSLENTATSFHFATLWVFRKYAVSHNCNATHSRPYFRLSDVLYK